MSNHLNNIELFDLYLNNGLAGEELAKFEEKLLNDEAFNKAFIEHKTLVLGISDFGKLELKNYIKDQVKLGGNGKHLKVMRAVYAVAASVILVVGLVFVFKQMNNSATTKSIEIAAAPEVVTAPEDTIERPRTTFMEMDPAKKEEISQMDRTVESSNMDDAPPIAMNDDAVFKDLNTGNEAEASPAAVESGGYKIVSEKMLRDTFLLALYVNNSDVNADGFDNEKAEKSTSKKRLPSVYNNNNYNSGTESKVKFDSVSNKKAKAKAIETKPDKYSIEYWQSPINFKGYKLVGFTLQLYGLGANQSQLKLFKVDYQLYLRMNGVVYALKSCVDGCAFTQVQDDAIRELILQQD